jgi:hypothetical protein
MKKPRMITKITTTPATIPIIAGVPKAKPNGLKRPELLELPDVVVLEPAVVVDVEPVSLSTVVV